MTTNAPQENKPSKGKAKTKAPPKPKAETITYHDPFSLGLVGIAGDHPALSDVDVERQSEYPPELAPFADEDRLTANVNDAAVANVERFGIKTPVSAKEVNGRLYVTDGRQRVIWARLATLRVREAGDETEIRVPVIIDKASDVETTLVIANEHRKDDGPVAKARKAERLRTRGYSEDEIQNMFGVTAATLANWRHLTACEPSILARVETGEIPVAAAYQIGQLPAHEQSRALDLIETSGATLKGAEGVANVARAAEAARAQAAIPPPPVSAAEPNVVATTGNPEALPPPPSALPAPPVVPHPPALAPEGARKLGAVALLRARTALAAEIEGTDPDDRNGEQEDCALSLAVLRRIAGEAGALAAWPHIAKAFGDM